MSKAVKKLGTENNYKRPKVTYQEKLSKNEIKEKLEGYIKVDDLSEVPIDTHIRYFVTEDDGTKVFRMGGFLLSKNDPDKYIVLTNRKSKWSVQTKNTIFYKKMSHTEEIEKLHREYKKKIQKQEETIKKLKLYIKKMKK